jgi:hypothetical protein
MYKEDTASELKINIPITYVKGSEKNRTMFAPSSSVKKGNGTKNIKTKVIDPPTKENIIKLILLTSFFSANLSDTRASKICPITRPITPKITTNNPVISVT